MRFIKELDFAKNLALKAGEIMFKGFSQSKITVKSNLTPVTETDLAISKLVIREVKKRFPSHLVLDEELQNKTKEAEYLWVCDPVDGTIPFSHHVPTSMFSLALCHEEEPVVAVIYDPFMKRLLYTTKDSSSYMNDQETHVKKGGLNPGDFIYGIPYWNPDFNNNKFFELVFSKKIRVSYIESIVYECMLVAVGITRAMVAEAANPWDRAAAKFIVENAGGKCTDEKGERLTIFGNPQYFIASNGTIHEEILNMVKLCLKK